MVHCRDAGDPDGCSSLRAHAPLSPSAFVHGQTSHATAGSHARAAVSRPCAPHGRTHPCRRSQHPTHAVIAAVSMVSCDACEHAIDHCAAWHVAEWAHGQQQQRHATQRVGQHARPTLLEHHLSQGHHMAHCADGFTMCVTATQHIHARA